MTMKPQGKSAPPLAAEFPPEPTVDPEDKELKAPKTEKKPARTEPDTAGGDSAAASAKDAPGK